MKKIRIYCILVFTLFLIGCERQGTTTSTITTVETTIEIRVLQEIRITSEPRKEYFINETFSTEGLIVELVYSDGNTYAIDTFDRYGVNVITPGMDRIGIKDVLIAYRENNTYVKTSYQISVYSFDHFEQVEATCAENGNIEYWGNKDYGKFYLDQSRRNEVTLEETVIHSTGNHVYEFDCNGNGTHNISCGGCDQLSIANCIYEEGICTSCQSSVTRGLTYSFSLVDHAYTVTGPGTSTAYDLVIPKYYNDQTNGLHLVTAIGESAFSGCDYLATVTIPDSITTIGIDAFLNCNRLIEVYNLCDLETTAGDIDNGYLCYLAEVVHTDEKEESILFVDGDYLFAYIDSEYYLIECINMEEELVLPVSINHNETIINSYMVNDYAFYGEDTFTTITIPSSVIGFRKSVFSACDSLVSVYYEGTIFSWCKINFLDYLANPMSYGEEFYIKNSNDEYTLLCNVEITSAIQILKPYTFYGFECIQSVDINDFLIAGISKAAFRDCVNLSTVNIPFGCININAEAFYNCESLSAIKISETIFNIDANAFNGCTNLNSIWIDSSDIARKIAEQSSCGSLINYAGRIYIRSDITSVSTYIINNYTKRPGMYSDGTNNYYLYVI